mgnify:FL=1
MAVTVDDVRSVAALARLSFEAAEEQELTGDLNRILEYMEKLSELDTEGIEPTSHVVPIASVFRADRVEHFRGTEAILAEAPDRDEGYFRVPKVID